MTIQFGATRRQFIKGAAALAGGGLLAGCAGRQNPREAPVPRSCERGEFHHDTEPDAPAWYEFWRGENQGRSRAFGYGKTRSPVGAHVCYVGTDKNDSLSLFGNFNRGEAKLGRGNDILASHGTQLDIRVDGGAGDDLARYPRYRADDYDISLQSDEAGRSYIRVDAHQAYVYSHTRRWQECHSHSDGNGNSRVECHQRSRDVYYTRDKGDGYDWSGDRLYDFEAVEFRDAIYRLENGELVRQDKPKRDWWPFW